MFKKLGTYVPGTSTSIIYHKVFSLFWKKCCRARPQPTTLSAGRPTVSLRDMLQVTLLRCQARSYGSQTGVGVPLLQCWVPLSVCFSSVLAWMGFAVARNKEACPSHPHVLESDRTPAFLLLLLLLLLLLHYVLLVGPARCFTFYSNSSAKAIWWWMLLYRTLRKVTCTNMRKKTCT